LRLGYSRLIPRFESTHQQPPLLAPAHRGDAAGAQAVRPAESLDREGVRRQQQVALALRGDAARPEDGARRGGKLGVWVPKSLVEDNRDGTFTMPEWLALEKGLI